MQAVQLCRSSTTSTCTALCILIEIEEAPATFWADKEEAMHLQACESKGHPSVPHIVLLQQLSPILTDQWQLFSALIEGDVAEDPNKDISPKLRNTVLSCWHGASTLVVGPDALITDIFV